MSTKQTQADAILKMIDAWNDYGIAHLETVPADAHTCAALPSFEWGQTGYRLLALVSDIADDPALAPSVEPRVARMLALMLNTGLIKPHELEAKLGSLSL